MNKSESKYYNTAILMDEALLLILENKEYEFISVKEVCVKAGVNRSTFYLHYETMDDLLNETINMVNDNFFSSFKNDIKTPIEESIKNKNKKELVLIKDTILRPYLNYILENKRVFLLSYKKYKLFKGEEKFSKLTHDLFIPITNIFGIKKDRQEYFIRYFRDGIMSIVHGWLANGCQESIDKIIDIIYECTGIEKILSEIDNSKAN